MKNNKKTWIIPLIVVVLVAIVLFISNKPANNNTVKIGFSIPLSGNMAFTGEGLKAAALMAKENFGKTKYNYEFIFEDDEFKAEKTASVANKLINIDKVNAIVSFGATGGNVVSPIAESKKIIHFGVTTDLNVAKGDFNFIHFTPPSEQTKTLIEELEKRGLKKIAYFVLNSAGFLETKNDIANKISGTDISIVSEQKFNSGEKDFKSYISKAKSSGADVFVLGTQSPEIDVLMQQIKNSGITVPITSINSFEISKNPSLYEGLWYIGAAVPSQRFSDAFYAKVGSNPTFGAANVYDIVSLIIAGVEKGNSTSNTKLQAEQISSLQNFDGALGSLNFDENGAVISKAAVKVIKSGKPVLSE